MRLPIRVCPDSREGLWGWALRAAEANRYPSATAILSMVGYLAPIRPRAEVIANLAEAAGVTGDYFEPLVALRRGNGLARLRVRGIDVPRGFLDVSSARVCQMCLKEAQLIPAEWHFAFWSACPCHGIKLISHCPQCGQAMTWNRPYLDHCGNRNCSFAFSRGTSIKAEADELTLPIFVAKSMNLETIHIDPDLNELFQFPTASEALNIIDCLGSVDKSFSRLSNSFTSRKILENAASLLTNWPSNFNTVIRRIAISPNFQESNEVFRKFGQITARGRISPAHASILRDTIFRAAQRTADETSPTPHQIVISKAQESHSTHAPSENITCARNLSDIENIREHQKNGNYENKCDFTNTSEDISLNRNCYINASEMYEAFCISPKILRDLESFKLINRSSDSKGGLYVRKPVEYLFEELAMKCRRCSTSKRIDREIVTLKGVCRRFAIPLIEVVQSILRSELIPECHYSSKVGLDSIGIAQNDIFVLLDHYGTVHDIKHKQRAR